RDGVVELRAEERRPAPVPRERREGLEDGDVAAGLAEARLEPPDRDDDRRRHAVGVADTVQQLAMLFGELARTTNSLGRHAALQILLERERHLRLAAIALDHTGQGREAAERLGDQLV